MSSRVAAVDWDEVKGELEGLSKAQLRLLIQLAFEWLPEDKRDLVLRLIGEMKKVNEEGEQRG